MVAQCEWGYLCTSVHSCTYRGVVDKYQKQMIHCVLEQKNSSQ